MSCVSARTSPLQRRGGDARRGFTLTELLIALTIAMAFVSGVYVVFIQVLDAQRDTEQRVEAMRNARSAIMSLTDEIKRVNTIDTGIEVLLLGFNNELSYGDGIDNDDDSLTDEEVVNGEYDAPIFSIPNAALFNQHTLLQAGDPLVYERPAKILSGDVGDADLDVDTKFGRDIIQFRIFSDNANDDFDIKTITYAVTDFEGEDHVLVRQTRIEQLGQEPVIGLAPIAFNVLSFDLMYWNPNAFAANQGWVVNWDSTLPPADPIVGQQILDLPASVFVRLNVYSGVGDFANYTPGEPVETVMIQTVINLEEVIDNNLYNERRLRL